MKKRRKSLICKLAVLAFAVYVGVTMIFQLIQVKQKSEKIDSIKNQYAEQQKLTADTQRLLSENDQQFMESVARQKLNYAKPNERIYKDASGN